MRFVLPSRTRFGPKWLIAVIAGLLGLASSPGLAQDDTNLERRWNSLAAAGYEPLTIPTDWYDPVATVAGAETAIVQASPDQTGIAITSLAAASGWAKTQNSTALLVAQNGKLVFERYWQGTGRDTLFNPQSMSKTVLAMLVGIAIERGEIASVDDPVAAYLSEWEGDPRGAITVRQMLWMSAGLEQGDNGMGYSVSLENPIVRHSLGSDFTKLLLSLRPVSAPGERFDYNNQVNQLLGMLLERASGQDYEALLSERIWKPLELADAKIPLDRAGGMVLTSCCILSRPVDWLRIGQLFVDGGRYKGTQVVPKAWLNEMIKPSPGYRGYGYQVWVHNQRIGGKRPPRVPLVPWQSEAFAAPSVIVFHGHGGQRTYVMPDKQLVIVRAARQWPDAWDDALLPNVVWRGTKEIGESTK